MPKIQRSVPLEEKESNVVQTTTNVFAIDDVFGLGKWQYFLEDDVFVVPTGIERVRVTVIGAGADGEDGTTSYSGAGGGAGGFGIGVFSVEPNSSYNITAGPAAASFGALITALPGSGTNGGEVTGANIVSYKGGDGGQRNTSGNPGSSGGGGIKGGNGSTSTSNTPGGGGGVGKPSGNNTRYGGGTGTRASSSSKALNIIGTLSETESELFPSGFKPLVSNRYYFWGPSPSSLDGVVPGSGGNGNTSDTGNYETGGKGGSGAGGGGVVWNTGATASHHYSGGDGGFPGGGGGGGGENDGSGGSGGNGALGTVLIEW